MKKIVALLMSSMMAMTVVACTPAAPGTTAGGTTAGTTTAGTTASTTAAGTTASTTAAGTTAAGTTATETTTAGTTASTTAAGTTTAGTTASTTAAGTTTGGSTVAHEATDPQATITVQVEGTWMPYYEQAVETMKGIYPASTIELVEVLSFPNLDTIDKTDARNEAVPDVFAVPADRLPSMINKEALAPIPAAEMAQAVGGYDNFDTYGSILKDGDDYLAFPLNIETLITFVNPTNAKALGIDLTKPYEISGQKGTELAVTAYDAWFGVAFANAANINLLGKDGETFTSDLTKNWSELEPEKQGVITELYNYWKRVYESEPALWDETKAGGQITEMFKDGGKVAFRIDGPWATPDMVKAAPNLEILPLSHITVNGAPLKHWQGMWGLGINSRIEEDQAKMTLAQEFIKELVNPANAEQLFTVTGKILPNVSPEVYEQTGLSDIEKKTIQATIESFQNAENRPLFAEWGGVWDTWKNALLSWNNLKPATAEEAYKALQDSFTAMMGNLGQ